LPGDRDIDTIKIRDRAHDKHPKDKNPANLYLPWLTHSFSQAILSESDCTHSQPNIFVFAILHGLNLRVLL
jgi:hypothetical protein